jgi:hypothetical protein
VILSAALTTEALTVMWLIFMDKYCSPVDDAQTMGCQVSLQIQGCHQAWKYLQRINTSEANLRSEGHRSGNGRFNDAGYRGGARPPVQSICAAGSDIARLFWMYRLRAGSRYKDLVTHDHRCCRRNLPTNRIFGWLLVQVSDLSRPISWNQKFAVRPPICRLDNFAPHSQSCRMALAPPTRLGVERNFPS